MVSLVLFFVPFFGLLSFQPASGAVCNDVIDIGVIIDSSASMGDEWLVSATAFVIQLTDNFTVSYDETRFGMISFSDEARTEFRFSDYSTKGEVEIAVGKVDSKNSSTRIDKAIHLAKTELFGVGGGGRPNAEKFLIIATDGRFSQNDLPTFDSLILPILDMNITLFVVGIGDETIPKDLNALALNKHDNVFLSPSDANRDLLVKSIRLITAAKCAVKR